MQKLNVKWKRQMMIMSADLLHACTCSRMSKLLDVLGIVATKNTVKPETKTALWMCQGMGPYEGCLTRQQSVKCAGFKLAAPGILGLLAPTMVPWLHYWDIRPNIFQWCCHSLMPVLHFVLLDSQLWHFLLTAMPYVLALRMLQSGYGAWTWKNLDNQTIKQQISQVFVAYSTSIHAIYQKQIYLSSQ